MLFGATEVRACCLTDQLIAPACSFGSKSFPSYTDCPYHHPLLALTI